MAERGTVKKLGLMFSLFALAMGSLMVSPAYAASSLSIDFESPPYTIGTIHNQDGWSKTGPYDVEVGSNSFSFSAFGSQVLRISNAITSGSFGDQTFSKSLTEEAGEVDAIASTFSSGPRQPHFEAQFDFASTLPTQQTGLFMSVSPDRGDGARMSYLGLSDGPAGIDVIFYDVQGENAGFQRANFVSAQVATGLSREVVHTAKFDINFLDGPSNDVVKIYIDGNLVHTGTTWENYFRFDTESQGNPHDPVLENKSRTVDSLLFRVGGTAAAATIGNGFLVDNLSLSSGPILLGPATNKEECRKGGWKNFNNPAYKNQGDCVSAVASQGKAGGNPIVSFFRSLFD